MDFKEMLIAFGVGLVATVAGIYVSKNLLKIL
jgi:hypothetical protein